MKAASFVNVSEARRLAKRVLPPVVFDYVDGGADDESTLRANETAFADITFRPRLPVDLGIPGLATTVVGKAVSMPVLLAPCGLVRVIHPDSGSGVARAAAAAGTLSLLSTGAGTPIEVVAAAAPGAVWFQLYAFGGRHDAERLIERAGEAGVDVLVVTVDTPAVGNRERDLRHGVVPPLRMRHCAKPITTGVASTTPSTESALNRSRSSTSEGSSKHLVPRGTIHRSAWA